MQLPVRGRSCTIGYKNGASMNLPPKPREKSALDKPYVRGDLIPLPEVVESDSDTDWDTFAALQARQESHFAATQPAPLGAPKAQRPASPEPVSAKVRQHATLDETLQEARRNNRVCPKPEFWQRVYDTLPQDGQGRRASPPLTGPAWSATPSLAKRMSFREHLEWAETHGALDRVFALLKDMGEDDWHHMGD
jgi:hypothetical protein